MQRIEEWLWRIMLDPIYCLICCLLCVLCGVRRWLWAPPSSALMALSNNENCESYAWRVEMCCCTIHLSCLSAARGGKNLQQHDGNTPLIFYVDFPLEQFMFCCLHHVLFFLVCLAQSVRSNTISYSIQQQKLISARLSTLAIRAVGGRGARTPT